MTLVDKDVYEAVSPSLGIEIYQCETIECFQAESGKDFSQVECGLNFSPFMSQSASTGCGKVRHILYCHFNHIPPEDVNHPTCMH